MSMWDHLPVETLIDEKMAGNYGLAPKRWRAQLEAIRALPEREDGMKLLDEAKAGNPFPLMVALLLIPLVALGLFGAALIIVVVLL